MLIACVKTGSKYSPEYVTRLRDGVARNLTIPHQFVCFTDDPVAGVACRALPRALPGWWAKIGLCEIEEPLIYFDLDVIITGDLSRLLEWEGFGIISDPWLASFNSSVMVMTGKEADISLSFKNDMMGRIKGGDQTWFTMMRPNAKTFPSNWFPSFKAAAADDKPPDDAMAIVFHGLPKPHEIASGWVPQLWKTRTE